MSRLVNDGPPGPETKQFNRKRDNQCYTRAFERDQMTFTLVEQDVTSPRTILFWIMENFTTCPVPKLRDAFETALGMQHSTVHKKSAD
jgi:hypothetical protein